MLAKHLALSLKLKYLQTACKPKQSFGSQRKAPPSPKRSCTRIASRHESTMSRDYTTVSYVTTPNEDVARQLSEKIIVNKLAACVNIVKGIESVYMWKDKLERDTEFLLIIKSHSSRTKDLTEFVETNHPYDCPEVVTLKVDSGSKSYLDWVFKAIAGHNN